VTYHLGLNRFTKDGVDEALKGFWDAVDFLAHRKVELMSLGGIPLCAYAGRSRILSLLKEARERTQLPVSADFEDSIDALNFLKIKKVAVAAKWDRPLMQAVTDYLAHASIEVLGFHGEAHTAQQVIALGAQESIDIAVEIAGRAFEQMPDADGLLLAGGAWLVLPAIAEIERRFGKPVVNNPAATYWKALKGCRVSSQLRGFGRLLDSACDENA
jgi:maleate cis-trans isomerase